MSIEDNDLFLHVGLPKTGTSAFQAFLFEKKLELAKVQCVYPERYLNQSPPKHQFMIGDLMRNDLSKLDEILFSTEMPRLVLSSEGLTNHLYDFPSEALKAFRRLTHKFNVRMLIVTRNTENWLKSYYKQAVINPHIVTIDYYATELTLAQFSHHPRIIQLLDHTNLIQNATKAFGADEVINGIYEMNWVKDFCDAIGIVCGDNDKLKQINESPANWAIEIMRQVNTYRLPESQRLEWKAALQEFTGSNHTLLRRSLKIVCPAAGYNLEPSILASLQPREEDDFSLSSYLIKSFQEYVKEKKSRVDC